MAEDIRRISGHFSGLAVLLTSEVQRESPQKSYLISYFDDIGFQCVERTLEHIFDLPYKSVRPLPTPIEPSLIHSILKNDICKFPVNQDAAHHNRDGICITDNGCGPHNIAIDDASIFGGVRFIKQHSIIESHAVFSSVRANACVWKGQWMYEIILETSGIQQLGWATLSCPFTEHKGVGDAEDSYAFDGRRVSKWNKEAETYGQSWVVGDIIGCCIDLDHNEISFYRNGLPLGVAFDKVRKMAPGLGYYPAVSLSQGERCHLNFGAHPFKYPIEGFHPLQSPPTVSFLATHLLQCLLRLLELQQMEKSDSTAVEKLGRLKRFAPIKELFHPIAHAICEEFFAAVDMDLGSVEYVCWGPLVSFFMDVFKKQVPHDYESLDGVIDLFLEFRGSRMMFQHVVSSLSCNCKIATLVLTECPYSGSYPYLALVCHILRREELMVLWWESPDFEFLFEGFLSRKGLNKQDLQCLMPSVWWPGSSEDVSYEDSMMLTTTTLSGTVNKIEEMHRKLCCLVIQFTPPMTPPQLPGSVFLTFLHNVLLKNRGADRNLPPPGVSSNSVVVSMYTVILHFLSEGFAEGDVYRWIKGTGTKVGGDVGFLHRGGQRSFPLGLFLKNDPHRNDISRLGGLFNHLSTSHPVSDGESEVIQWEEGSMDDEETKITHSSRQKPCCCSSSDFDFTRTTKDPIQLRSKGSQAYYSPIPERSVQVGAECSAGSLNDDMMDKPSSSDQSEPEFSYRPLQHHLRNVPTRKNHLSSATLREEELLDAMVLLYQIGLAPNFKQASYYMSHQSQTISLLEETDKQIKEKVCNEQLKRFKEAQNVYREELIDCVRQCAWYHISLSSQWKQRGMYATCKWIVELLLVLSKMDSLFIYIPEFYLEALVDCFHALRRSNPPFIPSAVFLKHGLTSFGLLQDTCIHDEALFSTFLNRLFDTLSWTVTEFSVSVREMQEKYQLLELQQRKCIIIFDLSCNLARVLEFFTHEIPQAFLAGSDMNRRRLIELIVFILNQVTSAADAEIFDMPLRRLGQSQERINRGMVLAPLVGIILNLLDANLDPESQNDLLAVFASMDCPVTVHCGFQYLLEYNWGRPFCYQTQAA